MKTLGMIGGMSWESTLVYYRLINEGVRAQLGGLRSGRCLLWSFDFAEIEELQHAGEWAALGERMAEAALALERGGAEGLVICTNTMHKLADAVQGAVGLPLLHIADATGEAVKAAGHSRVGLLATRYTMEQEFYRGRLAERHGLEVLVPEDAERGEVHRVIFEELCAGRVLDASRERYRQIIAGLREAGAECVVLGCTEIGMLISQADSPLPVFDTTQVHAAAAVEWMVGGRGREGVRDRGS